MKKIDNLILVEDDEVFAYLTTKIIKETNLVEQIKIFGDGNSAITYLKGIADKNELLPDLILLDLNMPILDGWGFLDEFISYKSNFGKKITIYIMTSSISPHDVERSKKISEVSDFIVKPVTKEKFINTIVNYSEEE